MLFLYTKPELEVLEEANVYLKFMFCSMILLNMVK